MPFLQQHYFLNKVYTYFFDLFLGFPRSSVSKETAAVQETQVQSLGQENPLEKEMAAHCSILAWRIL